MDNNKQPESSNIDISKTQRRPKSIWAIYILSILSVILLVIGILLMFINANTILSSGKYLIPYVSLFICRLVALYFFIYLIITIRKRRPIGWYLTIIFVLIIATASFVRYYAPEIVGEPLFKPTNADQEIGFLLSQILHPIIVIAIIASFFRRSIKEYFHPV